MYRRASLIALFLAALLLSGIALRYRLRHNSIRQRRVHVVRSAAARRAFRKLHPCPATGAVNRACPGYIIDHIRPLACGGEDAPSNMQWQTVEDAKAKDAVERRNCGS